MGVEPLKGYLQWSLPAFPDPLESIPVRIFSPGDIRFIDVDDKVLVLSEKVLNNVVSRDIRFRSNLDQHTNPADIGIEPQFSSLQINIAGQNVIENHVLDKIAPVVFLHRNTA